VLLQCGILRDVRFACLSGERPVMANIFPSYALYSKGAARSLFQYIPYQRIGVFTAACDIALIVATSVVTGIAYHWFLFENVGDVDAFLVVGSYSALIFVLGCRVFGLYRPTALLSASKQIRGSAIAWGVVLLFVTSIFFMFKTGASYSRGVMVVFGAFGFAGILAFRAIAGVNLRRALANGTLAGRRVVVIGESEELSAKSSLHLLRTYGTREVGRFQLPPSSSSRTGSSSDEAEVIDSAIEAAQATKAEEVFLALPWGDRDRRGLICERLRVLPLPVFLLPDQSVTDAVGETDSGLSAPAALEIQRAPLSRRDLIIKRNIDLVVAALGLVMLAPLFVVTSIAVRMDSSGPAIFRQRRRGFSGQEFAIFKFRTMSVQEDGSCIKQAQRDDRRVTRLGRLLRTSSIDETPQLINVLLGQMSIVGPRPHAVAHDDEYSESIDNYAFRHHVKPGITGWAQTHGFRGETADLAAMERRIELDLWYINNWSLWLDFRIIARTCVELLRPRNVY
jgi:Undecaprenyl-phosphate glucose phosphotransferase